MLGTHYDHRIVTGEYGNALLTDLGYVIADPCYVLAGIGTQRPGDSYPRFRATRRQTFPLDSLRDAGGKLARLAHWHEMQFDGRRCYWRDTGGDGVGKFGLCVDAGWIAAIPLEICSPETQKVFASDRA